MNFFKKSFLLIGLLALIACQSYGAVLSTNVTTSGVYILTTNGVSAYQVELTSTVGGRIEFFDADSLADPYFGTNYVTGANAYRLTYATNLVSSYVGANGYTNWYTNVGLYTINLTNAAATNALPSLGTFVVAANTYAVYTADMLSVRGLAFRVATNMTVVVNYRTR